MSRMMVMMMISRFPLNNRVEATWQPIPFPMDWHGGNSSD